MKKCFKVFIGASAVAGAATGVALLYKNAADGVKNLPATFTVTAHTGCEGTKDNSVESIITAGKSGADVTEFDLRFDKSGGGILAHDDNEINSVTLEKALGTVSAFDSLKVNVDCKTTDNLKEVYRLGEELGITERLFYTGIEEKDVQAAQLQTPQIPYYLNYKVNRSKKNDEQYIRSLIVLVKEKGALGLNINHGLCSKKMVEMFREEGLAVSVWTANDVFSMIKCLSFSPDNITTRYPATLIKLINHFK